MVEDGEADEWPSHDQHALCPVELRLEVEDEAVAKYSREVVRGIPQTQIFLFCLCPEEMTYQDERDHENCPAGTVENGPNY